MLRKENYNNYAETNTFPYQVVTAILKTGSDLERIIDALRDRGFRKTDITVMMSTLKGQHELTFQKETKVYKGAAVGGIIGMLIAIATSSVYGILIGAVIGLLIGLRIPEYVVRLYENSIRGGSMLISIRVDNAQWKTRASDILKLHRVRPITTKKKLMY